MASSLLYLRLLQRQFDFQRERRTTNIIICDNQGLLTRIEEAVEWTYITPNVTLRAEWDIESVILKLYQELEINFTFMHVKSHQDDETPTANLSLESRLNVETDRLATAYMQEDLTRRPVVALFPTAKVQLIIQEASVTRRIPQAIRLAAGMKDMEEYLLDRNSWTKQTFDDIHWEAHGAGHSHHRPQRCYLVKMCHRHLPVGETLHRRAAKYSPLCPGCRDEPESQNHYFQCSAISRIKWRIASLSTLRKQMEKTNTDEYLQETILDCIDSAMAGRAVNTQGPFQQALESQERIGWVSMLHGYWTKQWQVEYEKSYDAPPNESRKDKNKRLRHMARWQKKIIQTIWASSIKLWKTRNDERHGWDKESRDSSRRKVLHKELQEIYDQKNEYPQRVQRLLRASYEIHIQETVRKLTDWLDAYKGTFAVTWSPD